MKRIYLYPASVAPIDYLTKEEFIGKECEPALTLGQIIRNAQSGGIDASVTAPAEFDDPDVDVVDLYGDPRTDRLDLMDAQNYENFINNLPKDSVSSHNADSQPVVTSEVVKDSGANASS